MGIFFVFVSDIMPSFPWYRQHCTTTNQNGNQLTGTAGTGPQSHRRGLGQADKLDLTADTAVAKGCAEEGRV